ncbi:MAG: TatD family hydrolase [Candidatus Thorarchaeota archaeon]|nr:MAG: TatD family hydrolase [Candidatus Thorarchaeota archaeon]
MLVDVHNHFSFYQEDINRALEDIHENRVLMLSVSTDMLSYNETLELAGLSQFILPAFGVHPMFAHEHIDQLDTIKRIADEALMLGEIGLDRKWTLDASHYPLQESLLEIFLESAQQHDTIMILHVAEAEFEVLDMLEQYSIRNGIIHDYYGPIDLVEKIIDKDLYFAFDGSYLKSYESEIRGWKERLETVTMIPDDLFLIETDGPSGSPRRMPHEALQMVAERIAEIRNTTADEITTQSSRNFFNLIKDDARLSEYIAIMKQS